MQATRKTLKLGEQTFTLRWDMNAIATFERLTGQSVLLGAGISVTADNMLKLLWACIDADAAARNEEAPVPFRVFGSLVTAADMVEATQVAVDLIAENSPPGKANRATRRAAKKSRSPGSTNKRRSTSALQNGSSGR